MASDKEEWIKNKFKGAFHMDDSYVDWSSVKEIANHFPEAFLSIIEDVFPLATSAVFALEVTKGKTSSMIERNASGK